jgi:hypothetical protein
MSVPRQSVRLRRVHVTCRMTHKLISSMNMSKLYKYAFIEALSVTGWPLHEDNLIFAQKVAKQE